MNRKFKIIFLIIFPIIIDQIIKQILSVHKSINFRIIPGILGISYVENTGGAYGIGAYNTLVLIGVNLFIIISIILYLIKNYKTIEKNLKLGLFIILSGGLSNLIDRVFRGYVIDYIDINELIHFPVFNLADICIVIGVIIMSATILISTVKEQEQKKEKKG